MKPLWNGSKACFILGPCFSYGMNGLKPKGPYNYVEKSFGVFGKTDVNKFYNCNLGYV